MSGNSLPLVISIVLISAFGFGAFKAWRSLSLSFKRKQMQKTGRYRDGMFILDDAILLHYASQVLFIEKKLIRDVQIVQKGRGETPKLQLIVLNSGNKPFPVDLSYLELNHNVYTLKKSLIHWINSGKREIQTVLSDFQMPEIRP